MDLRVIVACLNRKQFSARVIQKDIVATLGPNIVQYHSIARYLRQVKSPLSSGEASDADDRKPIDDADESILLALNERPFVHVRKLS
jgi:hypothetical protein